MSDQLEKYEAYVRTIKRLLTFTGLWPMANPGLLYRLLPLFHGLVALFANLAVVNFCLRHFANLSLLLAGFGIALSFFTMIQKTICLSVYRKRLVELHESLAESFASDLRDEELRPILLSPLVSFYRPSLVLSIFTYAVNTTYMVTPFLTILVRLSSGNVRRVKYVLPLPGIYPWGIDDRLWLYVLHYSIEVYASMCLATFTSSIDSLFGFYIFQISAQLRTLSHRVRSLPSSANRERVIGECVSRHQVLIKCQRRLEQIYGPVVLWMFVTTAVVMCGLMYQASHISPGKILHIVFYMITKSLQMLLYGWFGTFLTSENETFREAVYDSAWPGSGERSFMKNILVMMTYKPTEMRACGLSTISIDLFATVANTALSYFFMIRTLEASNDV